MKATTIRLKGNFATGCWLLAGGGRHLRFPRSGSPRAPRSCGEQVSADLVEVGQRKHGLRSGQVLGQTAVSHFSEAPQLLDHPKGVFAARPGPRARPVDHPPALAQRPLRGRASVDPVAHSPSPEKLSIVFFPVRLIAEQLRSCPCNRSGSWVMSATLAAVALTVWTIPRLSAPMCSFIPKYQFLPLRVCFISGSRLALAFLVELGAAMMVASTMVPERSNSRRSSNSPLIESKIAWVSPCCSSRWRKRRIVVSSGTASSPSSTRAKRRIDSLSWIASSACGSD